MKKKLFSIIMCVLMVMCFMPTMTFAETANITIGGTSYTTLADAFSAANSTEGNEAITISIPAGTFSPTANRQLIITRDNVTISGAGVEATTIACGEFSCDGQGGIIISANNVVIKDMTVTSTTTDSNVSAIKITATEAIPDGSNIRLLDGCKLENLKVSSEKGHGLNIHGVEKCTVSNVEITNKGKCGISLANAKDVTIENVTFPNTGWGYDIGMQYTANSPAYANPCKLTLGEGNVLAKKVIYGSYAGEDGKDTVVAKKDYEVIITGAKVVEDGGKITVPESATDAAKISTEAGDYYFVGYNSTSALTFAINAATSGQTIELLSDITLTENIDLSKDITITGGKKITVYTNQAVANRDSVGRIAVKDGATLTLDGITLEGSYGADVVAPYISVSGASKLIIKDATINDTGTTYSSGYGLLNTMAATSGSKVTITGSTVTSVKGSDSGSVYYVLGGGGECELDVHDNTFNLGSWFMFNIKANGKVYDNTFNGVSGMSGVVINSTILNGLEISNNTFAESLNGTYFVLGGSYSISGNTFEALGSDLALYICNAPSEDGAASIENNTINLGNAGYGIRLYYYGGENSWAPGGDASKIKVKNNKFIGNGAYAVRNNDGWTGTLDASYNYFNGTTAKTTYLNNNNEETSVGNVTTEPYYTRTSLRNPQDLNTYVAPSGGSSSGTSTTTDNVTNVTETTKKDTGETTTVPETKATVKAETKTAADGTKTTTATVDTTTAAKIVEKAVENKSEVVVVSAAATPVAETAAGTTTEVAIPAEAISQISEKTEAAVTIESEAAKVTLDQKAVAAVAEAAGEAGTVSLVVETVAQDENKVEVDLKLETSSGKVSDFKGGSVSVTVKLNATLAGKPVMCVYIDDNGNYHKVEGTKNADGTFTFKTGHFSTYAIMPEDEANDVIAQQNEKVEGLVKALSLKATSSKTKNGSIKVSLKVDTDEIKDIEELGYTVKYKFYRSTKKSSGYKAKLEKAGKTYTNTTGKKGTRYYYKARVMIYDSEGNLIAKTALTQCKYACRVR